MKFIILFSFILSLLLSNLITAQVTQQWVARYNGQGNNYDAASSVAVDASGNVYVTGQITGNGFDYATIKYNSSGVQQWVAIYNGPGNSDDIASSIAVDGSGNVYVTGYSVGVGTEEDCVTIKYNSSGALQWVARYNGPGNNGDYGNQLVLDGSGNVYVTGQSVGNLSLLDYITIKYNSSGTQQWASRYNGPGGNLDYCNSIAVDIGGNVYVTGHSVGLGTSHDIATIKYNSTGFQQWVARYNGPGNGNDRGNYLKVDSSGNVYVAGKSMGSGTGSDFTTIKYNTSGAQQWVQRFNGIGNVDDEATSIALDGSGNVYVTGYSSGNIVDYTTIKYNPSGNQQWVSIYNGTGNGYDGASSIAVDASGNSYVTGISSGSGTSEDYVTIKYNTSGVQQWLARYNGTGNNSDMGTCISINTSGNVFVTGWSRSGVSNGTEDYATVKYTQQIGIEQISSEIPSGYKLSQNYPNPFNPTTKIKFDIMSIVKPDISNVQLIIYDVLGNEVTTLVNEQIKPGTYEVEFDGSNFSNGVYYYTLYTESFKETKRMVLIK